MLFATLLIVLSYPVNFTMTQDTYNVLNMVQIVVLTIFLIIATTFLVSKLNAIGAEDL